MAVQCTEAEWKIMEVLWEKSPKTMPEITQALAPATGWTRHTVITLLKRMQEKGSIRVEDGEKMKLYTPAISREEASQSHTKRFLNHIFSGKASLLVQNLVNSGEISVQEMEEILLLIKKDREHKGGD
ncbi:MAG: BlaI/MecI/CopY family transcriptional regulator [Clostridia bacterium]|nr:BlaI/MecI/CopY family transcriptional regulator [Clostridia bacterium]MBR6810102.1 BlaI/MecI/CopY family transcriptional regulator [Clostridia bacterium]